MRTAHCEVYRIYCAFHFVNFVIKLRASLICSDNCMILQTENYRTAFGFLLSRFSDWSFVDVTREVKDFLQGQYVYILYFLNRPTRIQFKKKSTYVIVRNEFECICMCSTNRHSHSSSNAFSTQTVVILKYQQLLNDLHNSFHDLILRLATGWTVLGSNPGG